MSDFFTPVQKGRKTGSWFHPSKTAVILSGIAVPLFQALITLPQMRVAFGTTIPDTRHETGHWIGLISGVSAWNSVSFGLIRLISKSGQHHRRDSFEPQNGGRDRGRTCKDCSKGS